MYFRYIQRALLCIFSLLISTIGISSAQEGSLFQVYDDVPVIPRGADDTWYYRWNEPGSMVVHDDQFYFFRNGSGARPSRKGVGLLTSPDGFQWEVANNDEPVFSRQNVEYARFNVGVSSVLVLEDGTWVTYFFTQDVQSFPMGGGDIGRATATSPEGPWTSDPEIVVPRGSEGEWDAGQVVYPNVIQTEDGFVMYYAGFMADETIAIGMATSEDGIHWEKYDDPATSESPFAESDPVIVGIDGSDATMPHAVYTEDGWVMIFKDATLGNILLATSADGIEWTTQDIQVITDRDMGAAAIGFMTLTHHEGTYYLYLEVAVTRGQFSEIYLVTFDGSLHPDSLTE